MRKVVVLLVAMALASIAAACSIPGGTTYSITVQFPDTAGLFVGNDVGILGVPVGTVSKIEPNGATVTVTLKIDGDVRVPVTAKSLVVSRSVATDRYVELTPRYQSGPSLKNGDVIAAENTRTPRDFDEVLNALNRFSTGIAGGDPSNAKSIRRFLKAAATTFGPNGTIAHDAVTGVSGAVEALNGNQDNAVDALEQLDELTGSLVAHDALIEAFIRSAASTSAVLAEQRQEFTSTVETMREAVDLIAKFADRNSANLEATSKEIANVLDLILQRRTQVEEFVEVLPLALANVDKAQTNGGILLRVPLASALSGEFADQCQRLLGVLCDSVGLDPTSPLAELLGLGR